MSDRHHATEAQRAAFVAMYGFGPLPLPTVTLRECLACRREPHAKHYDAPTKRPVLACEGECKTATLHRYVGDRMRALVPHGTTSDEIWQCTSCGHDRVWGTRGRS